MIQRWLHMCCLRSEFSETLQEELKLNDINSLKFPLVTTCFLLSTSKSTPGILPDYFELQLENLNDFARKPF